MTDEETPVEIPAPPGPPPRPDQRTLPDTVDQLVADLEALRARVAQLEAGGA